MGKQSTAATAAESQDPPSDDGGAEILERAGINLTGVVDAVLAEIDDSLAPADAAYVAAERAVAATLTRQLAESPLAGDLAAMSDADEGDADVLVTADAMVGDLMRALLAQVRNLDRPWNETSEARQKATLAAWEQATLAAVRQAVRLIAAREVDAVQVTLEKVTTQNGKVIGQISIPPRTEGLHDLVDAAVDSQEVLIVLPGDVEQWNRGELPAATPDQLDVIDEAARLALEDGEGSAWVPRVGDRVAFEILGVAQVGVVRETGLVDDADGSPRCLIDLERPADGDAVVDGGGAMRVAPDDLRPADEAGGDIEQPERLEAMETGNRVAIEPGDVVLLGAAGHRVTVVEVYDTEAVVESEIGGRTVEQRVQRSQLRVPGLS